MFHCRLFQRDISTILMTLCAAAAETVFAGYFDIPIGSGTGTVQKHSVPGSLRVLRIHPDRLLNIYPKLFYKGRLDFLIAGRGYCDDLEGIRDWLLSDGRTEALCRRELRYPA